MKKTLLTLTATCFTVLFFGGTRACSPPQENASQLARAGSGKIPIDAKRWYQVNNTSNGLDALFDGNTDEPVNTGFGKILTNYDAYYPLLPGETMRIESIRFFDGQGTNTDAPVTLSIITDTWQRIPIARFIGDKYQEWVGPDPQKPSEFALKTAITNARYLVLNTSGAYPAEMELYGTHQAGTAPTATPTRSTLFRQSIGVNAFEWNIEDASAPWQIDESRMPALKTFSAIRHYMDWEKLESIPGEYSFNPTFSGSWHYDVMYERCQAEGIEVLACLKTIPKWMEATYPEGQRDLENIPAPYGRDLSSPASYIEQARIAFQYMARYGRNKTLDPSLVKVSSIKTWAGVNTVKIGLGLIRYIECDNERDKTWKGRHAYQSGREYAANLSAFYDGHKKTLGPGVGAKNADPSVTVVIGGLAASSTDYVRAMIDWCREFRGYRADGSINLCWDVINQHLYANDQKNSQGGGSTRGAAPEVSGVGEQAAAFVDLSHQYALDMPVWITEAGYDTHQGSPLKAIPIGSKTVLQTQADWLLRTALLYTRVGIDRLFFYQLYDDNPLSDVQFSSMGLINGDKTRKPGADYLFQAMNLIGDYRYKETISKDPIVDRYDQNGRPAYVLVVPDEKGRTATYDLPVLKGDTVLISTPAIGRDVMTQTRRVSTTGTITINVSETPVFVTFPTDRNYQSASELDSKLGTLLVFPNPTADYVDISIENALTDGVSVAVYDAGAGRQQRQFNFTKSGQTFRERVDLTTLPYGMYLLEVRQGAARAVRKILKVY
ncbi:T9SS type A sorting domain-containing protein [Spirosoma rigui]|uniref:T9SS type A sorting domain-containing protein n=1 Tax=Spirosoma rigui TaxID=564064 RepID=UPI0009B11048|nr:T9SS type A sorting domain-containing protein [Spirosoma rigui]